MRRKEVLAMMGLMFCLGVVIGMGWVQQEEEVEE